MMYNLKKRSFDRNSWIGEEKSLNKEKIKSFPNLASSSEQDGSYKKQAQGNQIQEDKPYSENIFCKLKDFYKNSDDGNFSCSFGADSEYEKNKSSTQWVDEKMVKEKKIKKEVIANKISHLLKREGIDNDLDVNNRNFIVKKRKSLLHEKFYYTSQNSSKTKLMIQKTDIECADKYSCKAKSFHGGISTDESRERKRHHCMKEMMDKNVTREQRTGVEAAGVEAAGIEAAGVEAVGEEARREDATGGEGAQEEATCEENIEDEIKGGAAGIGSSSLFAFHNFQCINENAHLVTEQREQFERERDGGDSRNEEGCCMEMNTQNGEIVKGQHNNSNESISAEEGRREEETHNIREKDEKKYCFVNYNLSCSPSAFDLYSERSDTKGREKLNFDITKIRDEISTQHDLGKNVNDTMDNSSSYSNDNKSERVHPYYSNNRMLENEKHHNQDVNMFRRLTNEDTLFEEMKEMFIKNQMKVNIHNGLRENIVKKCREYSCNKKLSFSNVGNKMTISDKEALFLSSHTISDDYNNNCLIKHVNFKRRSTDLKNNMVEKKKKIKSIHNEILTLINADTEISSREEKGEAVPISEAVNCQDGEGEKRGEMRQQIEEEDNKDVDKGADEEVNQQWEYQKDEIFVPTKYSSIFCNNRREDNQNCVEGDDVSSGSGHYGNIYYSKMNVEEGRYKEGKEVINGYFYEDIPSNQLLDYAKKDDTFIKCISVDKQKKDSFTTHNVMEEKNKIEVLEKKNKECLQSKTNVRNNFLKCVKLIYEKEKKILEVNTKCIEKYSYFKEILKTYCKNNLMHMNEHHVDYYLSKILFTNDIINNINRRNFKEIMISLDFYGYLYDNIFLKNLCNKITINRWLSNRTFFRKIFRKKFLKIGIFYNLVYKFLHMNRIFIEFFFSKNGGKFMKSFFAYNKNKALHLINKIVADLKSINPSTHSVVNFLCAFFSHPRKEHQRERRKKMIQRRREKICISKAGNFTSREETQGHKHLHSNSTGLLKSRCCLGKTPSRIRNKLKRSRKNCRNTYMYIKNRKYRKSVLRNVLNRIWMKTDLYVKEEVYYDKNFTIKKKLKKKKINNFKKIDNFLYHAHDTSDSSAYSFLSDDERMCNNFYKSDENNLNVHEKMNETFYPSMYNHPGEDNSESIAIDYHENSQEENYEIAVSTNANVYSSSVKNIAKTFHSLDSIPNMSFDLHVQDCNSFQRGDSFLSLCFKEEEKCSADKYIKDISHLGIRISSKENKTNYFNCFDVNLKINIEKHLLAKVNYNISKDDEHISAFFPVCPHNPDYFGYKMGKNVKKAFNDMREGIMQEVEGEKQNALDIILNKTNGNKLIQTRDNTGDNTRNNMRRNMHSNSRSSVNGESTNRTVNCDEANFLLRESKEEKKIFDFTHFINSNSNERSNTHKKKLFDKSVFKNIDEIKIKDCNFILNVKIYPIRTLALYILYNSLYRDNNVKFVEFYSESINNEVKEWLLLFLLPNFVNKCIHKVTYPLKITKNIFSESNEFYEDFFSNEYLKINDIEKIIIYTKNNNNEEIDICPFLFCHLWLKSTKYKIDRWISSKINEILFTFPFANFLLSKYFSSFLLFIQLFHTCLDLDHMYLCKSHFYVSLKHNISFLHESIINVLFSAETQLKNA
ncbi:conserved Plasmodium protein, unknown function [Plasmodium ovale wallikeri]|uniref:Uncharacterized protein n=2 Tax=Plasmodium ovale TaxID=36330 RepID=A0A1A8YZP5_PLAOA|nr:conserved Plasmodium protein, unknown function [Plasmodium ovale wallikeri]